MLDRYVNDEFKAIDKDFSNCKWKYFHLDNPVLLIPRNNQFQLDIWLPRPKNCLFAVEIWFIVCVSIINEIQI